MTVPTLTDFLLARISEDEEAARAVASLGHVIDMGGNRLDERWYVARLKFSSADGAARSEQDEPATALFARHDPARVLAEVAAKRAVVEAYVDQEAACDHMQFATLGGTCMCGATAHAFRALASVYADHPDYDEAWSL